jgi:hypothetical protein
MILDRIGEQINQHHITSVSSSAVASSTSSPVAHAVASATYTWMLVNK